MRDKKESEAAKLAWQIFERTGDAGYYMLYCELCGKNAKKRK